MANEVELVISVEMQNALNSINQFQQKSSKDFDTINNHLENITTNTNTFEKSVKLAGASLLVFAGVMATNGDAIVNTTNSIGGFLFGLQNIEKATEAIAGTTTKFSSAMISTDSSIVGVSKNVAFAGAALVGLGIILTESNNKAIKFSGGLLVLTGTALVGFSVALNEAILLTGKFLNSIGSTIVEVAKTATHAFIELDSAVFTFNRTVESFNSITKGATGSAESWEAIISKMAESTGFNTVALRDSTKELVAALGPLGFNQNELKKLLEISADYAAQVGGDSVQATIDFVSALNGNAQSVLKYGVKLYETNVQQHLYAEGINKNFESLSDVQKMTARYNTLLEKHIPIAGAAIAVTTTLAGQQKLVDSNLRNLNQSFGAGTSIIENSNIVNYAFNKILSNINTTVVESFGFITALGGRILQIGGFFLEWSVKIALVYKAYKLLNILLETNVIQSALLVPIPLINKSLTEMVALLGGGTGGLTSLVGIAKTFITILSTQLVSTLKVVGTALKAVFANPIVLAGAAIAAIAYAIYEAFKVLEEKTGILSDLWNILKGIFSGMSPIMETILNSFKAIGTFLVSVFNKAFGLLIIMFSDFIELTLWIAKNDPFGIFSADTVKGINAASDKISKFNDNLRAVSFDISKLGNVTSENLKKPIKEMTEGSLKAVLQLETELKKVGKTEIQVANDVKNERLKIINDALKDGLILEGQFIKDKKLIEIEYLKTVSDIKIKQHKEEIARQKKELELRKSVFEYIKKMTEEAASAGGLIGLIPGFTNPNANLAPIGIKPKEIQQAQLGQTVGAIAGLIDTMLKGAEGATKLIAGIFSHVADALLPGLGTVVGSIVSVLAQGPDKVRAMIEQFVDSIPVIITNIITSLPVLIDAIINGVPKIIQAVVDGIPTIITEFIKAIPKIIHAVIANLPEFAAAILEAAVAFTLYMKIVGPIWEAIVIAGGVIWDAAVTASAGVWTGAVTAVTGTIAGVFSYIGGVFSGIGTWLSGIGSSLTSVFSSTGFLYALVAAVFYVLAPPLAKFLGDLGNSIGPAIQKFVDGVASGIGKVFENIAIVFNKVAEALQYLISLIQPILTGLAELITSIVNAAKDFFSWIIEGAKNFINNIISGASRIVQTIVDALFNALKDLGKGIGSAVGVGGGGPGDIEKGIRSIGNAIGIHFAKGGVVPQGYPHDNFPASLTSGEMVIPRDDVAKLSSFLDSQNNQDNNSSQDLINQIKQVIGNSTAGKIINVTLQVGEKELASVMLDLNRRGFRTT